MRLTERLPMPLLLRLLPLFAALAPGALFAQGEQLLDDVPYFEGAVFYKFDSEGGASDEIKLLNDVKYMNVYVKEGDYLIHIFGDVGPNVPLTFDPTDPMRLKFRQVFPSTRLFISDSNRLYSLDLEGGRAFRYERYRRKREPIPTAEPTGDTLSVLGYKCFGYKVTKPDEEITYFVSPAIRVNAALYRGKTRATANFLTKGLNGCIPLKTVRKSGGLTTEVIAYRVSPMALQSSQFRIPPGFALEMYDYRR